MVGRGVIFKDLDHRFCVAQLPNDKRRVAAGLKQTLIWMPVGEIRAVHPVKGPAPLLPGIQLLAVAVPEISR